MWFVGFNFDKGVSSLRFDDKEEFRLYLLGHLDCLLSWAKKVKGKGESIGGGGGGLLICVCFV